MKYDVLFWDMDNTLLNFDFSEKCSLIACFEKFHIQLTDRWIARYSEINQHYWRLFEEGAVTQEEVQKGRFESLFDEMNLNYNEQELAGFIDDFQNALGENFCYLEDSYDLCLRLSKNYDEYIVTNGLCRIQNRKYYGAGFDKVMKGCFVSEEAGCAKPDPEFFEYCVSQIECKDKRRILMIGDSLSSDVRGANNAGIDTCWLNLEKPDSLRVPGQDCVPRYTIHHLKEIEKILL